MRDQRIYVRRNVKHSIIQQVLHKPWLVQDRVWQVLQQKFKFTVTMAQKEKIDLGWRQGRGIDWVSLCRGDSNKMEWKKDFG